MNGAYAELGIIPQAVHRRFFVDTGGFQCLAKSGLNAALAYQSIAKNGIETLDIIFFDLAISLGDFIREHLVLFQQ